VEIPIIQKKDPNAITVEAPIVFNCSLVFTNYQGQFTTMGFACPPGLYPNPEYMVELIKEAQIEAMRALKMQTNDLSWRLPTPQEFVRFTSGNAHMIANSKYAEPYSVKLEKETDDNSSG
jgi:hypothetical protein